MASKLNSASGAQDGTQDGTKDYGEALKPGQRSPAGYAASAAASRGRVFREPDCPTRSPFQRDRDRILHSTSFRRLTYKTQVFLFHEGDHYRSRLTHSLEVAQIARTIARQLRLDEDLAEALALAHDLGHSPFGHAGERALDSAMRPFGGFDHNAQSVRVVTSLERKYLAFDGLNLTWEMLEGLVKHNGPVGNRDSAVAKAVSRIEHWKPLDLDSWASAEAQAASLADDIAYLSHDVDDGLRAHLLSFDALEGAALAGGIAAEVAAIAPPSPGDGRAIYEVTRRMITAMVTDVVTESRRRLRALAPQSPDDIRGASDAVVAFSPAMARDLAQLKEFLFAHVYRHPRVMGVMAGAESVVMDLFERYLSDPETMPEAWGRTAQALDPRRRARLVADFVSGQTDRYAIAEHGRLFAATPELR
ncbi:MAG: deoxyguanosinetriphosphate triphosphohydrolase [Hyphomicrobium sp.]